MYEKYTKAERIIFMICLKAFLHQQYRQVIKALTV
jgi:hypothetical protein